MRLFADQQPLTKQNVTWASAYKDYGITMKKSRGQKKVKKVMSEYKHGELHSGSKKGPVVDSRKQAVAIALSEARKKGAHIPKKHK
jgi:Family of unknown function (DUF6496)